jgi:hypothetical protein
MTFNSTIIRRLLEMSRKFEIEWPDFGVVITVDLLDDENPEICEEFWRGLPFQTIFAGSMSAGEMLKIPVPFPMSMVSNDKLVFFPEQTPGTLVSMGWGGLLLKYGTVAEPFRLPRIAMVPDEELEKLRNVAIKLRDAYFYTKEINIATLRRKE